MTEDNWSKKITFGALCDCFETISKVNDKKLRLQKLTRFFGDARMVLGQNEESSDNSLFPLMRLFLPGLDRERGAYGIKETLLAKLFIDLLKIGANSQDAKKLMQYKAPKSASIQVDINDFASVLTEVIRDRCYVKTKISVWQVNECLDKIVLLNAQRKAVNEILFELFRQMDATMFKWLIRILLKDVKCGLGQKGTLQAFHADAVEVYETNANLRKVI